VKYISQPAGVGTACSDIGGTGICTPSTSSGQYTAELLKKIPPLPEDSQHTLTSSEALLKVIFLPRVHSGIRWRRSKPAKPRNRKREQIASRERKECKKLHLEGKTVTGRGKDTVHHL
jgi:hypothetical protein